MLINSKVIEIIFAIFILANNFYTTYNIIYTECKSVIYNVAILSIVNNMITFSLVLIFIARDIENKYYNILLAIFMVLSCAGSTLIIMICVSNTINECDRTFFYIVMVNVISSIIPIILFSIFFLCLIVFYIPYDIIKRKCYKKNTERYVQTDSDMIGLMDNQSGKTFVFPPDESYDFDAVEI